MPHVLAGPTRAGQQHGVHRLGHGPHGAVDRGLAAQQSRGQADGVAAAAGDNAALAGNAVLDSQRLIVDKPRAAAGFLRATNRAIVETLANPSPAMAAVTACVPLRDETVEAERWRSTAHSVAAPDTRSHGLSDTRQFLVDQHVGQVVEAFTLQARRAAATLFNRSFMPARAKRALKT